MVFYCCHNTFLFMECFSLSNFAFKCATLCQLSSLLKNSAWTWLKEKHEFFSYFINVFNAESTESSFFFLCYSYFSCLYEEKKKNLNKPRREGEKKAIILCFAKVRWRVGDDGGESYEKFTLKNPVNEHIQTRLWNIFVC